MNAVSRYIETKEIQLHCLDWENDGPPALLLHGASFCASVWSSMARMLSKRFRVLSLDLRGHGDSGKPAGMFSWEHLVGDFVNLIDILDLKDVLIIGHSRGGGVSALGSSLRPDRISKAVFIEPSLSFGLNRPGNPVRRSVSGGSSSPTHLRRAVWPNRDAIFERYRQAEVFQNWREDILWDYIDGGTYTQADGQLVLKCSPEIERQISEAKTPDYMFESLENIKFPVLHVTSENTMRWPDSVPAMGIIRASASNFRHVVVPGASHYIPQEKPEMLEDLVREFIS
jgi:pimeloyl-ACP methyl ester carboxylesterase